jgi:hypothetical protein
MVMTPHDYQYEEADNALKVLRDNNLVYIAMEERTGKTITALLVMEQYEGVKDVLIVTKKAPIDGWQETLDGCPWLTKNYTIINYHSAKKMGVAWDAVILDEAHSYISAYPKRSTIWNAAKLICVDKPIVYVSATPYAQGVQLLFNQLALSSWSPWKRYKSFYRWYDDYAVRDKNGNTETIRIAGRDLQTYKRVNHLKAMKEVEHLFVTRTRKSLGFAQEPKDVLHYLELTDLTRGAYNTLLRTKRLVFDIADKTHTVVADSKIKLRTSLHMLEGGILKVGEERINLIKAREKVDYILSNWGDTDSVAIMYLYVAEGDKLRSIFKNALILQCTRYAEGIDLSHIDHLIIYSQDHSTSRHTQRRARQANINRTKAIDVHYLLVKKAISDQVYATVSINKVNFVDSTFKRDQI